jgi:transposase
MECVGIDVSKTTLSCAYHSQVRVFPNTAEGYRGLKDWAGEATTWCMEATGRFHDAVADFGFRSGIRCLVVNPGRAKKYLGFVDSRAKTDRVDALALERLGATEGHQLRAFRPVAEPVALARDVLVRRRALVEARVSLAQVAESAGDPTGQIGRAIEEIKRLQKELEKELSQLLRAYPAYENLLSIPGIGPLSAAILVCTLERGEFSTSDSWSPSPAWIPAPGIRANTGASAP